MQTVLIVATLVEVVIVIAVLAVYLVLIARTLRNVSKTLGLVTFGVRAIDRQTQSVGPALRDVNGSLEQVAQALERAGGKAPTA